MYDDAGQTIATIDALAYRTSQVYDPAGRRIELMDANANTVTFLFDAKGQDVGGIDALGNRVTYQYDGNGQQTLKIDPLAQRMTTVYDAVNRRIEERYADGQRHTFAFDSVGNQVRMADSTGITTSVYDAKNRITAVINPGNRRVTNSYDAIDRRTVMIEPEGGRFSYSYDANNRLSALINPQSKRTTQAFDAADRLVGQQQGNGSLVTNIYDDAGQTTGIINAKNDGTVINRFSYTFDGAGNRLTKAETGGVRTTWAYDGTSQLVHEERNDANALDIAHIYDPVGNRTVQIDSGVRTTATYDAGNQLTAENTAGARTTFTHDSCGNRTQKESPSATTFYTWDTCRNLTVVEPPAGKVTMTYNAAGKRVQKETAGDTKKFLYDFERLLQESDGADTVEKTYTSTQEQYGDLLSQYDGTDTLYHQYDSLGSTDALVSDAEMATDRYVYRAFGLETQTTGASDNALTFVGKDNYYRDSETDLYFLNARYYDPDSGRFVSEDPIGYEGGDVNLFRYVGNNPVNGTDPSGNALFAQGSGQVARPVQSQQCATTVPRDFRRVQRLASTSREFMPTTYLNYFFGQCLPGVHMELAGNSSQFAGFRQVDFLRSLPAKFWADNYLLMQYARPPSTEDFGPRLQRLYREVHSLAPEEAGGIVGSGLGSGLLGTLGAFPVTPFGVGQLDLTSYSSYISESYTSRACRRNAQFIENCAMGRDRGIVTLLRSNVFGHQCSNPLLSLLVYYRNLTVNPTTAGNATLLGSVLRKVGTFGQELRTRALHSMVAYGRVALTAVLRHFGFSTRQIYGFFNEIAKMGDNAIQVVQSIVRNPGEFLHTLGRGVMEGIREFFIEKFTSVQALVQGTILPYLFGKLTITGFTFPTPFSFQTLMHSFLQLLGLSIDGLLFAAASAVGISRTQALAQKQNFERWIGGVRELAPCFAHLPNAPWQFVQCLLGLANIDASNTDVLRDALIDAIRGWAIRQIPVLILGIIFPASNIVRTIYTGVVWIFANAPQIAQMFNRLTAAIVAAASGNIQNVKDAIKRAGENLYQRVLDFLGRFLGLDALAAGIRRGVQRLRSNVDRFLRRILRWMIDRLHLRAAIVTALGGSQGTGGGGTDQPPPAGSDPCAVRRMRPNDIRLQHTRVANILDRRRTRTDQNCTNPNPQRADQAIVYRGLALLKDLPWGTRESDTASAWVKCVVGKHDRSDAPGHLIANRFGGSGRVPPEVDPNQLNIFPQHARTNRAAMQGRESRIRNYVQRHRNEEGFRVCLEVILNYPNPTATRPNSVTYNVWVRGALNPPPFNTNITIQNP